MTVAVPPPPGLASRLINGLLGIPPLAQFAKHQARQMMIKRAERIGVSWIERSQALRDRNWDVEMAKIENPDLVYPDYYLRSFHAYERGNLSWEAASEVEVAAYAVHATIWSGEDPHGDAKLRQSYHDLLKPQLSETPRAIVDLGCSVGMSTFALQELFPQAELTGVDLSPYFLAVADYRSQERGAKIRWVHAAAESTGLPENHFDLVSSCLMFHELPQEPSRQILHEARRLLRPGGHLAIMDMNPQADSYVKMPPYILTLLKSTEPYLDRYFCFDMEREIMDAGFERPTIQKSTPRHRTIVAKVKK
ncbi:class I SAM-dependent methyltransferase [Oxynema sp. CENA135]|uniref:class I SAM-dependent methyltransferase n=1 Tax=Oxynema sp. CENA135 TaxID=984206 RepID=UPI001909D541|nr:class I SAM-dependent methyltransferase [Oxynema sp. CENA135]MBK4730094.1 class I SAM-dependent methyltransferase [Oxynema sp. CENA135]